MEARGSIPLVSLKMKSMQAGILQPFNATHVENSETLIGKGNYYVTTSLGYRALILNCPSCGVSNILPSTTKFKVSNLLARILMIDKGLTITGDVQCFCCASRFRIIDDKIFINYGKS